MKPEIDTAMVLAAGLGTRMRPLTDDRPKALVEVGGKALVDHTLDRLAEANVARAVVNVHHFADRLERHVANRTSPRIEISDERAELLETGGALVKAKPLLGAAPFFACNIDSVWSEEGAPALELMRRTWDADRMDGLLLLADMSRQLGFHGPGDFFLGGEGRLERRGDRTSAPYAYMGVQILQPRLLEGFPEAPFSANEIWNQAMERGRLCGVALEGFWMHVGDPQARDDAEARLAQAST